MTATFIPEWGRVNAREIRIRPVLNALDESHIIRRPLHQGTCPVDLFVQHPIKGWLALAIEEEPAASLASPGLFSDAPSLLEQRLARLQQLRMDGERGSGHGLGAIVLMWNCSQDEVRALSRRYLGEFGTRLCSKERFMHLGAKLVSGLLAPIALEEAHRLMGEYFPENKIAATLTTRRFFQRDNSATLGSYFLDAHQEQAAKLDLVLPQDLEETSQDLSIRVVNGVAGSGKTLIALNRALLLARLFPLQQLALLIHNRPVVADLNHRLHRTLGALPENLKLLTFMQWAVSQWKAVFHRTPKMAELNHVLMRLEIHRARVAPHLKHSAQWLLDEFDFINDRLIRSEVQYADIRRAGRVLRLRRGERAEVWALFCAVTGDLAQSGLKMWSALPREAALAHEGAALPLYDHILIDEAQFGARSWFELAKRSLKPGGQLFLCADPNQGFLKNRRLSWKSAGLDLNKRVHKLTRPYRTTRTNLESANGVLGSLGVPQGDDDLQPDYTRMPEGLQPVLMYTASPQDTMERLRNELAWMLSAGGSLDDALVIYGESRHGTTLHTLLGKKFETRNVWWFNKKEQQNAPPAGHNQDYLRLVSLGSATGLESAVVFLVGIESLFPASKSQREGDDEDTERLEESVRKLYMAMTRAARRFVALSSQPLPPGIECWFDVKGVVTAPGTPRATSSSAAG